MLLLLIFTVVHADTSCGIACFLGGLVVHVPDLDFSGRKLLKDYNVSLTNITCQNFQIDRFDSSVPTNTSIEVGVKNLAFVCTGNWDAKYWRNFFFFFFWLAFVVFFTLSFRWFLHERGTLTGTGQGRR